MFTVLLGSSHTKIRDAAKQTIIKLHKLSLMFRVSVVLLQWSRDALPLQHVLPAAAPLRSARSRLLRGSVCVCACACVCVQRLRRYTQRHEHEQPPHSARAPAARPTARINSKTDKNTNSVNKRAALCASVESKGEHASRETSGAEDETKLGEKVSVPPADDEEDEEDEEDVSSSKCALTQTVKCLVKTVRVRESA